jgi:hypothetical protein
VERQATKQTSWWSWCSQSSVLMRCWLGMEISHTDGRAELNAVIFTAFVPEKQNQSITSHAASLSGLFAALSLLAQSPAALPIHANTSPSPPTSSVFFFRTRSPSGHPDFHLYFPALARR